MTIIPAIRLWDCEREALRPPARLAVSEWANANMVLPPEESPRMPGPYRWQITPYVKSIMDLYRHPDIRHLVLKWATQLGKTRVLYNILGHIIDQNPSNTMMLYPTDTICESISRARIQPMIEASPALKSKIPSDRRLYQLTEMHFPGMGLYITGAQSATGLIQRPIVNLLRDEVNKYPALIGEHGDPLYLSEQRLKASWDIRKIIDVSSPTSDTGNITRLEAQCQVILEYYILCPFCNGMQTLSWENIKFEDESTLPKIERIALAKASTSYECCHCGKMMTDKNKEWMISPDSGAGWYPVESMPLVPSDNPIEDLFDKFNRKGIKLESIACRLSSFYSPMIRFGDITEAFLQAHLSEDDRFDKLRSVTNDWFGREWVDKAETKTDSEILNHRCDLPPLIVPDEAIALTAGIDMQKRGFYFTVWAWARNMTSWLIRYGYLMSWDDVTSLIFDSTYERMNGGLMNIWRAGIDTGGTNDSDGDGSMTDNCYQWLARYGGNTVYGIKGASMETAEKLKGSIIGRYPGSKKPIPGAGVKLWVPDTGYFKDIFNAALQIKAGDPGAVYLHADTGIDYAEQITSEEKRRDRSGHYKWQRVRGQNHYLDATIYARIMVSPLCLGGLRVLPDAVVQQPVMVTSPNSFKQTISIGRGRW